jgi:oxygen-independent coproporphyrinogen-3 oxidase
MFIDHILVPQSLKIIFPANPIMAQAGLEELKKRGIEKQPFGHDFVYRFPESREMPPMSPLELASDLEKKQQKAIAFYFHIPFCPKPCHFCHYYKEAIPTGKTVEKYLTGLKVELTAYRSLISDKAKVQSVFFGGGTPTLLTPQQLNDLLEFFSQLFPLKKKTEVSVESSPETLSEKKLGLLREGGFNRLSIGSQDLDEAVLSKSGRAHSPKQAETAVKLARNAGFENINMDFIYGLPGQSPKGWRETVDKALQLDLESVVASDLRVQKNTPFFTWKKQLFPSVKEMREMYYCFVDEFLEGGYFQQFPYQFVKKGREMLFLENQWGSGNYIGIGASSCSFVAGWDYNNAVPLHRYLERVNENSISASTGKRLSQEEKMLRFAALGLKRSGANRRDNGASKKKFKEEFGVSIGSVFGNTITELLEIGLLKEARGYVGLDYGGLFFHDEVARRFFRKQ